MKPTPLPELSPGDWAVLGAVAERPTHGFALAQMLAPDGSLGRVWSLPRPVVYQVIKKLLGLGLLAEKGVEPGVRGPARTIVAVTVPGRRVLDRWLAEPVDHVRDVRSMLLLKLALLDRVGGDPAPLLAAQRDRLQPVIEALEAGRDRSQGFERVLVEWRISSSRATVAFLDAVERVSPEQ